MNRDSEPANRRAWFGDRLMFQQLLIYGFSAGGAAALNLVLVLVLVRLVSSEAYAGLVLAKASLLLVTSLGSMGLSQAAVRWAGQGEGTGKLLGTVLAGAASLATPITIVLIGLFLLFDERLSVKPTAGLSLGIAAAVLGSVLNNELVNWARASQQPARHAVLSTARAVLQLIAITVTVAWTRDLRGFIYGTAVAELSFMAVVLTSMLRQCDLRFDRELLTDMLAYGWPHTMVIGSSVLLAYSDRFILFSLARDPTAVAHYDAAWMAVSAALALLVRPFNLFLFPAYMRYYAAEGALATIDMISRVQRGFLVTTLAFATVLVTLRRPLLQLLFPAEYAEAASIFPAVAYAAILNGTFMAAVAGLYISRNTIVVGVAAVTAVAVNVACNLVLIPLFGIDGASLSAAISATVQIGVGHHYARRILPIPLPLGLLAGGAAWLAGIHWITR